MKQKELKERTEMLKRITTTRKEAIATAFYINAIGRGMIRDAQELKTKKPFCDMISSSWPVVEAEEEWNMKANEFALLPEMLMSRKKRNRTGTHYTDRENIRKAVEPLFDTSADVLDPACGGGSFLLEMYNMGTPAAKLHGIELDETAAAACEGALLLAEWDNGEKLVLPDIRVADALTYGWNKIRADVIVGNPPYLGSRRLSKGQKQAMKALGADAGLDLCAGWLIKADMYIRDHPDTKAGFILTDSITQGVQVRPLWKSMQNSEIFFAHKGIRWKSWGSDAEVTCCIIGLSAKGAVHNKFIDDGTDRVACDHINSYLMAGEEFCLLPGHADELHRAMSHGSVTADRKSLVLTREGKDRLVADHPETVPYIRKFLSAKSVMNGWERWCLWLTDAPDEVLVSPFIAGRLKAVKRARQDSRYYRNTPPNRPYQDRSGEAGFLLPRLSSPFREYMPVFNYTSDDVPNESLVIMPGGELWEMAILSSKLFMDWVWLTSGRYSTKSRFSAKLSWYTFPMNELTTDQKRALTASAEKIIAVRNSIAVSPKKLYNKETMPEELKAVLEQNDLLVQKILGMSCLADVMARYRELH